MTSNLSVLRLYDALDPALPSRWETADDRVMGGKSVARLYADAEGAQAVCLGGQVSLDRGGGFVQMRWPLDIPPQDMDGMSGVYIEVRGNGEHYSVHVRTRKLWLPWQSYRHEFVAMPEWQVLYLPFADFAPYRTQLALDVRLLSKMAVVAIGRVFEAEVCVRKMGFYREIMQ